MSFAPILGPEPPSHAFIRSSISAYLSSLAALCSSGFATIFGWVDNLATRLPSSCCPVCFFKNLQRSNHSTETKNAVLAVHPKQTKTTALVFDTGTKTYTLKKLEDIDGESTVQLIYKPSLVPQLTTHIVEKAIYHNFLPISAQSVRVQHPGGSTDLFDVHIDDDDDEGVTSPPRRRGLRHHPSLVNGFYIIPTSAGTRTTTSPEDAQPQLVELPATPGPFKRRDQQQQQPPFELPADEIPLPTIPQAVLSSPPRLCTPRPRSPKSRKTSPLLAPPSSRFEFADRRRISRASSMGSASIQIGYAPSSVG